MADIAIGIDYRYSSFKNVNKQLIIFQNYKQTAVIFSLKSKQLADIHDDIAFSQTPKCQNAGMAERRNAGTPERRNAGTPNCSTRVRLI